MAYSPLKISDNDLDLEEISWSSIREDVLAINSSLTEVIDDLYPGKKYTFYRAKYSYGAKIVDKGQFYLPKKDKTLLSINDERIPDSIKNKIGYSYIPLCLIMSRSNEVFVETNQRVVPLNFFYPGDMFGVFEVINQITQISSEPLWSVTAGARTSFLLPRISDAIGHNKIRKEFNIQTKPPETLFDHFEIFKAIAAHSSEVKDEWKNEVIIFTKEWFDDSNNKSAKLYKFLLMLCWKQLQLFRDTVESNLCWSKFSEEMGNRNMKPRPYLVDMVKHLASIAHGAVVAFSPAVDSLAVPIDSIEKAYIDIYGLKNYFPTIMQPAKFNKRDPVYSSLSMPTLPESTPYMRNAPSIMDDERELKRLIQIFSESVSRYPRLTTDDPIYCTKYDFYHTDDDPFLEINNSRKIITEDERFLSNSEKFKNRVMCSNSPFFRGCIRVSLK